RQQSVCPPVQPGFEQPKRVPMPSRRRARHRRDPGRSEPGCPRTVRDTEEVAKTKRRLRSNGWVFRTARSVSATASHDGTSDAGRLRAPKKHSPLAVEVVDQVARRTPAAVTGGGPRDGPTA